MSTSLTFLLAMSALIREISCAPFTRPLVYSSYATSNFPPSYVVYTSSAYTYNKEFLPPSQSSLSDMAEMNTPRLYQLACYLLPYYNSPYLSLLCLIGLIGGTISQAGHSDPGPVEDGKFVNIYHTYKR